MMTDIRNGVNAGKTVTVHGSQITLNGWSGTGYTILDPESGDGAYMIGGGLDGGVTNFLLGFGVGGYLGIFGFVAANIFTVPAIPFLALAMIFLLTVAFTIALVIALYSFESNQNMRFEADCFLSGFLGGLEIVLGAALLKLFVKELVAILAFLLSVGNYMPSLKPPTQCLYP